MSAIFGLIFHDSSPVTEQHLESMAAPIRERLSGGIETYVEGAVGLGWVQGETTRRAGDIAAGGRESLVVAADARLDNSAELAARLGVDPNTAPRNLIAKAHQEWRGGAASHLLGAFSYAVWDRPRQILTIARDQIGVRPVYIARDGSYTAFATDVRSLLSLSQVAKVIDDVGIFHFFFAEFTIADRETTCFASVKRLPPAHVIEVPVRGEWRRRQYWSLDPETELTLSSDDEYAVAFRERFTAAVGRCVPAAGDVGSMLSGGLDSSSIATVASHLLNEAGQGPLHTYAAVFPSTPSADESEFSRAVSESEFIRSHEFRPGDESPLESVMPFFKGLAQPFFAPNLFVSSEACRAAHQDGLRVLLDGTDGDTTVGHGHDRFLTLARAGMWSAFARETHDFFLRFGQGKPAFRSFIVKNYALPELQRLMRQNRWVAGLKGIHDLGRGLGLSRRFLLRLAWNGRNGLDDPVPDLSMLRPEFIESVSAPERFTAFAEQYADYRTSRRPVHHRNLTSGAIPLVLEALDAIAAPHQIEYRFPFCDRELIEFCLAVPVEQQIRNGWTRWILRKAMNPLLPEKVCWRAGKSHLTPVHIHGLQKYDSERLRAVVADFPDHLGVYVDRSRVGETLDRFLAGTAKERDFQFLWQVVILDAWLRSRVAWLQERA
jgi:asparagine synthase (glutamine-hydrolysing)